MRRQLLTTSITAIALAVAGGFVWRQQATAGAREARATLDRFCIDCHNGADLAGDIDFAALDPHSVAEALSIWETAVRKLNAGEMPPPDVRASGQIGAEDSETLAALATWLDGEVGAAYDRLPPDPGRITARRLNRIEYQNTVRDLLGVDFVAADEFPADDSVLGFDNNANNLTVSPTLLRQYLNAAEKIAQRAVGGGPLPGQAGFFSRNDRIRRIDPNSIELTEVLDYDAEYLIRVELLGARPEGEPPVDFELIIDGERVFAASVPVQKTRAYAVGGNTQLRQYETRVFLTAASHTIRAGFLNDAYIETLSPDDYRNNDRNIYPDKILIAGPYPAPNAPAVEKPILSCDPASGTDCIDRILAGLVYRAFRRPVGDDEIARFRGIYDEAAELGYGPRVSLQYAIAAVLVSPHFLFRQETDPAPGTHAPITDFELATRLSYFLWSSMPDAELMALAEQGALGNDAAIRAQVERMLDDPKAAALSEHFVGQWLETRSLAAISRDRELYPEWNDELGRAMAAETELFFASVLAEDRPISDFIDGNYTFVNGRLAEHYGIAGIEGEDFRRVELATPERSGIFTQASVLTVTSYPNRTSVVLRGKYLLDNVLAAPPPGPPADVPGLDEAAVGTDQSLREQMEAHRTNPTCASCHVRMDPLGFGLENYDATGKWRIRDGSFPVDASGELPNGRRFDGPAELKAVLADNLRDFAGGLAEKLMTYALGRGVESPYDRKTLRDMVEAAALDDYRLRSMIAEVATSVPFRERSGLTAGGAAE